MLLDLARTYLSLILSDCIEIRILSFFTDSVNSIHLISEPVRFSITLPALRGENECKKPRITSEMEAKIYKASINRGGVVVVVQGKGTVGKRD